MKNLLKSDFYRLFKSLSFYICLAIAVLLFGSNIFLLDWANKMLQSQNGMIIPLQFEDGISYAMTAFMNNNVLMIIGIFTAIFITAEFSHGTMKNVVSKGFSKLKIYLSKLVTMTVASYIMILAAFLTGWVSGTVVTGKIGSFTATFAAYMLKTIGIELLLIIALVAVLVMVAMIIRNLGGVIAVNIIGVMSLEMLLFLALEFLVDGKVRFSEFSLMYNITFYNMNMTAAGADYIRSFIVGAAFLVVTTVFGITMFKKSDVK